MYGSPKAAGEGYDGGGGAQEKGERAGAYSPTGPYNSALFFIVLRLSWRRRLATMLSFKKLAKKKKNSALSNMFVCVSRNVPSLNAISF